MSCVFASNHRIPAYASPRPATPLTNASSTLSTSSCRTRRHRVAPIEMRTAISRERSEARASRRFATFAQAIRRTKPNRAHQRPEQHADLLADHLFGERRHLSGDALVRVGKLTRQMSRNARHLGARLLDRHAVGEAAVAISRRDLTPGACLRGWPLGSRQPDLQS